MGEHFFRSEGLCRYVIRLPMVDSNWHLILQQHHFVKQRFGEVKTSGSFKNGSLCFFLLKPVGAFDPPLNQRRDHVEKKSSFHFRLDP